MYYHLHRFQIGQRQYRLPNPMDIEFGIRLIDERKVRLSEVAAGAGQRVKFLYEYDFGDSWRHSIKLEGIVSEEPGTKYPRCTDGGRACPPEDVGGLWDYTPTSWRRLAIPNMSGMLTCRPGPASSTRKSSLSTT